MDLTSVEQRAEGFLQRFYRTMYQHHTTTSPTISLQQIYEEADLFNPEMVAQLREALLTTPTVEHDRLRRLFRFVGEGLLRRNLLPLDQELAHYYDQLSWPNTWAEHDVLSPNLHVPTQPDADRLAVLIGVYNQRWQFLNAQLTDLGLGNVLSFYELITNIDPITLLHSAEEFLDETDNAYQGALAAWAAAPDDRWQLEAALGGDAYQLLFPAAELVPTIEDTLYHLTIDVTKLPNLLLEVNRQLAPGLALAFPVRVPEEIYACVFPAAGIAAYEELLGVVGMIMPILLLNPKQTWMHRRLLDPAIQVACAELFTQLVTNSTWRADLLGDEADDPQLQQLCELRRLYRCAALPPASSMPSTAFWNRPTTPLFSNVPWACGTINRPRLSTWAICATPLIPGAACAPATVSPTSWKITSALPGIATISAARCCANCSATA